MSEWAILGVHAEREGSGNLRVRMVVNDQIIDEDFPYGPLTKGVPVTEDVLSGLLAAAIDARVAALAGGALVKDGSLVVDKPKAAQSLEARVAALEARVNKLDPTGAVDAEVIR